MTDLEKLTRLRELLWPNISSVIERDRAWEELGMSFKECQELYALLALDPQPRAHKLSPGDPGHLREFLEPR